jgi:hypothetical protein
MNLFEVTYTAKGEERKIRIVAANALYATIDFFQRRLPGPKAIVSTVDQGVVFVAEPHKKLSDALLSRVVQVGALMDAIDEDIAGIEVDLARHTETMKRITVLKERLSKKDQLVRDYER